MENASTSQETVRVHIWVSGRVQGVGYRAATWDTATLLKLRGWVRNLRDGRVEAVFEGSSDRIGEMLRWCHKGPPAAAVTDISVEYETPEGLRDFQVTR